MNEEYVMELLEENDRMYKVLCQVLDVFKANGLVTEEDFIAGNDTDAFLHPIVKGCKKLNISG